MTEVIYISVSMIALSWFSSLEKKLRLYVQNSVSTILRMVQWTLNLEDGEPLPLYHSVLSDQGTSHHCTGCNRGISLADWSCVPDAAEEVQPNLNEI